MSCLPLLTTVLSHLLAHQGGWDEMLMVAVPIAVFAGLLYSANKRASKVGSESDREEAARNERAGPR